MCIFISQWYIAPGAALAGVSYMAGLRLKPAGVYIYIFLLPFVSVALLLAMNIIAGVLGISFLYRDDIGGLAIFLGMFGWVWMIAFGILTMCYKMYVKMKMKNLT